MVRRSTSASASVDSWRGNEGIEAFSPRAPRSDELGARSARRHGRQGRGHRMRCVAFQMRAALRALLRATAGVVARRLEHPMRLAWRCPHHGRRHRTGSPMMLTFWLDRPIWLIFGSLALLVSAWCLILMVLSNTKRTRPVVVGVLSVLLSLLMGFVVNDAWERQRQAFRVVQTESAQARAVFNLSRSVSKDPPDIRMMLAEYIESSVVEEWPAMANGEKVSSKTDLAFGRLLQAVVAPNVDIVVGRANHSALLAATLALQTARSERLALSEVEGDDSKWAPLLALMPLTSRVIAAIHTERPASQAVTLAVFGLAMVITLGVVTMHERPSTDRWRSVRLCWNRSARSSTRATENLAPRDECGPTAGSGTRRHEGRVPHRDR